MRRRTSNTYSTIQLCFGQSAYRPGGIERDGKRQCECFQWQDYRFTSRVRLLNEQQGCVKDVLVYLPVFQLLNHNRNHISLLFDCDFCLSVPLSIWACDHRIVLQPCCKSRTLDNFCIYSSSHLQRERERGREREREREEER